MGKQIRQWIATITCNLCVAMTGTAFCWMAPLMVRLTMPDSPVPMTKAHSSWLTSIIETGELATTVPAGLLADVFGRKAVLISAGPICIIGWILIIATKSVYVLYFVRFLHGIPVAIAFTVGPMYLAEVVEPKMRGKVNSSFQSMWNIGCLYAYCAGPYLSYNNYAYVCIVVPFISTALFFLVPESPYFYLLKGEKDRAFRALSWLRAGGDIDKEYQEMESSIEAELKNKGSWRDLFATRKDTKAFLIVQFLTFARYYGGMTTLIVYATQTFEEELSDLLGSDELTIIFGLLMVVTTFSSSMLTDRIGRKPLLLISCIGGAVFNLIVTIIYYLDSNTSVDVRSIKWIAFLSIIAFSVITNLGMAPLMTTMQAEYFPSKTRGIAGGITEMVASLVGFVAITQYQPITDTFGSYMNYLIFSLVGVVSAIVLGIFVEETAGQTLGEIQTTFAGGKKPVNSATI